MLDVVDTQLHFNRIGTLEAGIAAMDAVGVASVLFDDFAGSYDEAGNSLPGYAVANGAFRYVCPEAEAAAVRYPERFGVMRRIDYRDPDLAPIARLMAAAPHINVLRAVAWHPPETEALAGGYYDPVFQVAAEYDLPLVFLTQGRTDLLKHYAKKYPDLRLVIDHCGTPQRRGVTAADLEPALEMADFKNVTLKWSHAPFFFATTPYPFPDVVTLLKRAIAAFGAERIMWGSDFTVTLPFASWAEKLFYIRDSNELSAEEKTWILGRTARTLLRWPASTAPSV
jgi:predicted TIM-barrel fold metal-dependent hydrolase